MKDGRHPFSQYASYYDLVYSDKDYDGECDFLEQIFEKYCANPPKTILDVGCGTGNHLIPLAKRGYNVSGIDISEEMLAIARARSKKDGLSVELNEADLRRFDLKSKFDVCICMFAVLGYINKNADIHSALCAIRKHLHPGGLFVFDVWYGPAVMDVGATSRLKIVQRNGLKLYRFAEPTRRNDDHICDVNYYFIATAQKRVVYEGEELHSMRYYFKDELNSFLTRSRLEPIKICSFMRLDEKPSRSTWNIVVVSKAV